MVWLSSATQPQRPTVGRRKQRMAVCDGGAVISGTTAESSYFIVEVYAVPRRPRPLHVKPLRAAGVLDQNQVSERPIIQLLCEIVSILEVINPDICGHALCMIALRHASDGRVQLGAAISTCDDDRPSILSACRLEHLRTKDFEVPHGRVRWCVVNAFFRGRPAAGHLFQTEVLA